MPISKEMMARYKHEIGLLLVLSVAALFVSTCVPMPKSLLHSGHAVGVAMVAAFSIVHGVPSMVMARHSAQQASVMPGGTDLIDMICSRIC